MSGGSFDYLYNDAQQVRNRINQMAAHADEAGYPDDIVDSLSEAAEALREIDGYDGALRHIEWEASGDHSLDRAIEKIRED